MQKYDVSEFDWNSNKRRLIMSMHAVGKRLPGDQVEIVGRTRSVIFRHIGNRLTGNDIRYGRVVSYDYTNDILGIDLCFVYSYYDDDITYRTTY